jgi:hypothetical protein
MDRKEAIRKVADSAVAQAPKGMIFLMPVFALLLQILFWSSKKFYIEHLVFSLYYHAFVFFVLLLLLVPFLQAHTGVFVLIAFGALFLCLQRVYRNGLLRTALKLLALCVAYAVVLGVGAAVLLVLSLLLV